MEGEKKAIEEELNRVKSEVLKEKEKNMEKEEECFEKNIKIKELENELQRVCKERDRLVNVCRELKIELHNLQNIDSEKKMGRDYKEKVYELEDKVKDLSNQLKKWASPVNKSKREEQKLEIKGIIAEQYNRPYSPFIPSMNNTKRQTNSQKNIATRIKKQQAMKQNKKARNYNIIEDS